MFNHIKIGNLKPKVINAIVEIPKGTHNKYEYDEKLEVIKLDRVLHSPMHYPVDYGFVPETRADDGDHLDVIIITDSPVFPGCLMEVRTIGALIMQDKNEMDEKILAVPAHHPRYDHIKHLKQVPEHQLKEIAQFFADYKKLEAGEDPIIKGWVNRLEAYKIIRAGWKKFQEEEKAK